MSLLSQTKPSRPKPSRAKWNFIYSPKTAQKLVFLRKKEVKLFMKPKYIVIIFYEIVWFQKKMKLFHEFRYVSQPKTTDSNYALKSSFQKWIPFFCVKKFQNLISTLNLTVTIYCLKMKNSFFLNCWEYGKILANNFPVSEKMKPTGRLKLKFPKTPYVDDFLEFPV